MYTFFFCNYIRVCICMSMYMRPRAHSNVYNFEPRVIIFFTHLIVHNEPLLQSEIIGVRSWKPRSAMKNCTQSHTTCTNVYRPTQSACAFSPAETTNSRSKFLIMAKSSVRVSVSCADALSQARRTAGTFGVVAPCFRYISRNKRHAMLQCGFLNRRKRSGRWNMRRNNKSNTKHEGCPRNICFVSRLEGALLKCSFKDAVYESRVEVISFLREKENAIKRKSEACKTNKKCKRMYVA